MIPIRLKDDPWKKRRWKGTAIAHSGEIHTSREIKDLFDLSQKTVIAHCPYVMSLIRWVSRNKWIVK